MPKKKITKKAKVNSKKATKKIIKKVVKKASKKISKPAVKKVAKKKTVRKKKLTLSPEEIWNQLIRQVDTTEPLVYNMSGKFPENIALKHLKFGMGVVISSLDSKIEVVFEDGTKFLVQNR